MHGGSGSSQDEIKLAVKNGVIKMNIDTDTQWAYWQGIIFIICLTSFWNYSYHFLPDLKPETQLAHPILIFLGLRDHYEGQTKGADGNMHATKNWYQGQIGNPDGSSKPNKKFYDPRVWIRKCESGMIKRANESFVSLNAKNSLGDDWTFA